MDSLKSSDAGAASAIANSPGAGDRSRFRGHRGGIITMHRAMARFVLSPLDLVSSAALAVLFTFVWLISLGWICRFWRFVLVAGMQTLPLHARLGLREHHVTPFLRFVIPFPRVDGAFPDAQTWWLTTAAVSLLFAATFLLPTNWIPVKYIARGVLLVQASALLYFLWSPARFPHTPDSYMEGLVIYGAVFISFVPALFGITYYVFPFGLAKEAFLTALTMIHLSIFFPLQILVQALVLQQSVLFMPMLYIVFGLPMEVLILICFYSWGSSWSTRAQNPI